MQRHHWCVRKSNPSFGHKVEAAMLALRTAAIGLQKQSDGSEAVAVLIGEFGAEFEQERETVRVQCFARPHDQSRNNASSHRVQTAGGFELALQASPVEGM